MRKIIYNIFMVGVLTFTLASCDLDQYPSDGLVTDNAWETVADAQKFQRGMYRIYKNINGGIFTSSSDYQSDLFNATVGYGNSRGDLYRWDFSAAQYDVVDLWAYGFSTIREANNIINNIGKVVTKEENSSNSPEQIKKNLLALENIKADAYLMRAVVYHALALRFAKDFDPATASTELGLPLIEEIDVSKKPNRSTLLETYEFIKKDIAKARELMTTEGKANTYYFSVDVIDALEARVNLYMHKFEDAIASADKVAKKYSLVDNAEALKKMWLNDTSSEFVFVNFSSVDERVNSFGSFLSYSTANKAYAPQFIPTQYVVDLYEDSDLRKEEFLRNDTIESNNVRVGDVFMLSKYPGNPDLKRTEYDYYHFGKPFRVAESYLIAAEAAYMNKNEAVAKTWLNKLRKARGASDIDSSGDALFEDIKKEWVREFIGEGMRLDQLKRWGEGFTRKPAQNLDIVMKGELYNELVIPANHMKFVWEIPNNDLAANKNLIPNWKGVE